MSATPEQVAAGQAIYGRGTLKAYDFVVLGLSNHLLWKCPTRRLVAHYEQHITGNHLDVGVGTGYFLDHCRFPSQTPRLALMDLNPAALEFAARRLARHKPQTYRCNVLEPIPFTARRFDSIGISYLLHCLPGAIETKAIVFDHLAALMNRGGVLFGATLLQGGVERNWAARRLMDFYNRKGIFCTEKDTVDALKRALDQCFRSVTLEVIGCAALFSGKR